MKKYILSLSLLLASLTSANAKSDFYAGIDIQRQDLQLKTSSEIFDDGSIFKPSVSKFYETKEYNPNFFLGYNANKNLDIELGYSMSEEDKRNNSTGIYGDDNGDVYSSSAGAIASTGNAYSVTTKTTLKTQNISLDLKPSYQIDQNNSVYGILGLNYVQIKLRETLSADSYGAETDNYKKNILAPTVGFGYKLKIDDNFSVRTQFKYSHINKEIGDSELKLKSLTQLAVGFAYNF
jgi:opacity protein-like surface antigen